MNKEQKKKLRRVGNAMNSLYIVATPIGNLDDITIRAINVFKECDVILAEDTRVSSKLLSHLGIEKKVISLHHHTADSKIASIVENIISQNQNTALISDAGTPLISDPGRKIIQHIHDNQIEVDIFPIPGPSAVTAALSVSGMYADNFTFWGFIPHKKGKETKLRNIAQHEFTSVFFESPHRIKKTLARLSDFIEPNRKICVTREMTKKFEEYLQGTFNEINQAIQNRQTIKGEITVVIEGKRK